MLITNLELTEPKESIRIFVPGGEIIVKINDQRETEFTVKSHTPTWPQLRGYDSRGLRAMLKWRIPNAK